MPKQSEPEQDRTQSASADIRLARLLAASSAVIYTRSLQPGFPLTCISSNVEALFGYCADQFLAAPNFWVDAVWPEDLAYVVEQQNILLEKGTCKQKYRFKNSNGEYVWISDEQNLVRDSNGQPLEIVGVWSNIEQQKEQASVQKEKQYLADLLVLYISFTSGTSADSISHDTLVFLTQKLNISSADLVINHLGLNLVSRYSLDTQQALIKQNLVLSSEQFSERVQFLKRGQLLHSAEIEAGKFSFLDDENIAAQGVSKSLLVPLCLDDSCIGILRLYTNQSDEFDSRLQNFIALISPNLTQILHNAILHDRLLNEQTKLKKALYGLSRFRQALDSPDDAVFLIDPQLMRFVDFNKRAITSLGYSREELMQMGPHNVMPDHDFSGLQSIYTQVITDDMGAFDITTVHQHKEGYYIPVEIRLSPFDDQANKTTIIAMVRDISDRIEAAEALSQSEERWRSLAANSPDHIFLLDLELNFKFLNYPGQGVKMEDVIGQSVMMFVPPDFQEDAKRCFNEVLETGGSSSYSSEFVANGKQCYYESYVGPVLRDGEVVSLVVNARDITQRKLVEDKLRQSAVVVENAGEGVVVTNTHNRIVSVNHAFTEITLYSKEEVQDKHHTILRSDRHDDDFYSAIWNEVKEAGRWQGESWSRRKTGEIFPAWVTISTVRNDEGNVTNYVIIFSDISIIKSSQDKLDFLAHHDPLTGLPNRLLFTDRLDHAIQRANRQSDNVAVFFIDLDRFKNINDTLGHPVGDQLIQQAAQRLRSVVREEDTVARLGGDEFIIALEGLNRKSDADILARKVIAAFREPFSIEEHELHVTLSLGVSMFPADGQDGESLIKNADVAMYRAKEEGRNNYNFYTADLASSVFERLALESALRKALERNELSLVYQPQYCLQTNKVVACESLMRWENPTLGVISPARFVPIAEESSLIIELGQWGLLAACSQMKRWLLMGATLERIAVNVSAVQLQRGDFVATIRAVLDETGLAAQYLELEVTESVIMCNSDHAIDILSELKALGVSLAIDDFGTGYSSLSYLKRLPVDKLKIDRSFVSDIPHDSNDMEISRAVIALAKSLGLKVVAEGLETEEQRKFMISEGSQDAQGYLFGKPVLADEFFKLYLKHNCDKPHL